jgi:hypothetical protein
MRKGLAVRDKLFKRLPLLAVLLFSVIGCSESSNKKEGYIKEIIKSGLSEREDVLTDPDTSGYRVFRDGSNDGVCYEYIFASEGLEMDPKTLKTLLLDELKTMANEPSTKAAIKSGIYLRFVYKSPTGEILGDQILTSSDFGW